MEAATDLTIERSFVADWNLEAIVWEPREYDQAIVGVVQRCGSEPLAVYDYEKLVEVTMERSDSDGEDDPYLAAAEYVDFNIVGAYVGEGTPMTLWKPLRSD